MRPHRYFPIADFCLSLVLYLSVLNSLCVYRLCLPLPPALSLILSEDTKVLSALVNIIIVPSDHTGVPKYLERENENRERERE
jgi:hypothetical protein